MNSTITKKFYEKVVDKATGQKTYYPTVFGVLDRTLPCRTAAEAQLAGRMKTAAAVDGLETAAQVVNQLPKEGNDGADATHSASADQ